MHRVLQVFIDSLFESVDAKDLHNTLAQVSAAFDLECFAYLSMPTSPGVEADLISTYPTAWTSHYLQNHYERLDPVIQQSLRDPRPFEWGREIGPGGITKAQRQFFDEAAEFGIRYGLTLPIHDVCGPMAAVTFAVDERSPPFRRCVEKKLEVLQLLAGLFHVKARNVLSSDRIIDGVSFSPRQWECILWAARGKSATDIACIIGISPRTVAYHIEKVKAKLGVRTTCQAVARLSASMPNLR